VTASRAARERRALGDWQTPDALAAAVVARVRALGIAPASIVEPTCGEGALLAAAARAFPAAALHGWDLSPAYVERARARLPSGASLQVADFYALDWPAILAALPSPILVLGNPPWVTSATLGALGGDNRPARDATGLRGLDARTGKSNFDVSEWMIRALLRALVGRVGHAGPPATLAMICKSTVARKLVERAAAGDVWDPNDRAGAARVLPGAIVALDARRHFDASVSASLLVCRVAAAGEAPDARAASLDAGWPVYDALAPADAPPRTRWSTFDGALSPDAEAAEATATLAGACTPAWRSGLKHDCARVMELTIADPDGAGVDGLLLDAGGAPVDLDPSTVFPLAKGTDVARRRTTPSRAVIVPQRALGEDTADLARDAPRTFRYLTAHAEALRARKSSVYRGQPEFAIFGVGPYAFAPWKIAVSALHKRLSFVLLGPQRGRPTMLDDTCYFLPFDDEHAARDALAALEGARAQAFYRARIFWDDKRPIRKSVLQRLDLAKLIG
jgi:hypothetical protein